ncbi:unnamed protein product [Dicrocoelium dendriticum]|nr:unnamed protein product [Dicrocoelium dendriticum]
MEFDVFEKLSELETRIYVLEKELKEKDAVIQDLMTRNAQLEQERSSRNPSLLSEGDVEKCDLARIESGKSIADALRETSETALRHTGYMFDERTGLYFDQNSGYYYDPDNRLFFQPESGVYYSYNSETGEYTYHSSVDSARWKAQYASLLSQQPPSEEKSKTSARDRSVHKRPHRSRRSSTPSDSDNSTEHRVRHGRKQLDSFQSNENSPHLEARRRHRKRRKSNSSSSSIGGATHNSPEVSQDSDKLVLEAKPIVYPPGVRLVVLASAYTELGTVFVLSSDESSKGWGCIGRNPTFCPSVNFPDDPAVGTIHCEVIYEENADRYVLLDRESSSGTYINGQALEKRVPFPLRHGDVLRIGSSRLLVHIHRGPETCGQCDSELVKLTMRSIDSKEEAAGAEHENSASIEEKDLDILSARLDRDAQRRKTLNLLKEKYGIKNLSLDPLRKKSTIYIDRAARRRAIEANLKAAGFVETPPRVVPIEHQVRNVDIIQPVVAGVSVPLGTDNRGAKLLAKMGWSPGQGLGKDSSGILEPVSVSKRVNAQAGFGSRDDRRSSGANSSSDSISHHSPSARIRAITRERYKQLE